MSFSSITGTSIGAITAFEYIKKAIWKRIKPYIFTRTSASK